MSRAWMEVDLSALRRNLGRLREVVGQDVGMIPSVKADAYGVGLDATVRALEAEAPWGYGVATVPEGLKIRALGVTRSILVLSPTPYDVIPAGVEAGLTFAVSDLEAVQRIVQSADMLNRDAAVHAEVDTGMGRSGFHWTRAPSWVPALREETRGRVQWEGVFTHFHSAGEGESAEDGDSVAVQVDRFDQALRVLTERERTEKLRHLSNSAGILRRATRAQDLVRPGLFLYGGRCGTGLAIPDDVVAVRGRIVLVRDVEPGTTLGYGATYCAAGVERWATVGIGYGDGLPRALGNRGSALIGGRRVPIIGRISMDLTVVDITGLGGVVDVRVGGEVTFLGADGPDRIPLEEVADLAGTISYEVLTGFSPRLPRVCTGP